LSFARKSLQFADFGRNRPEPERITVTLPGYYRRKIAGANAKL